MERSKTVGIGVECALDGLTSLYAKESGMAPTDIGGPAGRQDLANTVARFGGFRRMADHLHLAWRDTRGGSRQDAPLAGGDGISAAAGAAAALAAGAAAPPADAHLLQRQRQRQQREAQACGQQSPALQEAAAEVAALMEARRLDHVPCRAELEAAGEISRVVLCILHR